MFITLTSAVDGAAVDVNIYAVDLLRQVFADGVDTHTTLVVLRDHYEHVRESKQFVREMIKKAADRAIEDEVLLREGSRRKARQELDGI